MNYYKILDKENNFIDMVDSFSLRYAENGKIFSCFEEQAQYIAAKGIIYRVGWLNPEDPIMKGKFPIARAIIISEEEYKKYQDEKEKIKPD